MTSSNSTGFSIGGICPQSFIISNLDLYDELKVRDIAQKEFINVAAHELRNPIQPILGLSQVLRSKKKKKVDKDKRKC